MKEDIAISVKGVSKDFKLPHEKADSIKSLFVNPFNKNRRKYEMQRALRDISFDIKKGEFFGIVGRNGSGKSTLLKIIAGIYQPNKGKVTINGRLVPFIELGVGFNPELSGRENVYLNGALLGFSEKEIDEKYNAIVDFAELERFMDQKLKNYSSGMQVRLAFSVATILAESDILLIDEVLAVGDADFQRKCFSYFKKLKKDKKTVVFVSHDMAAIREYCDRAVLINNSIIEKIGNTLEISNDYTKLFQATNSLDAEYDNKNNNNNYNNNENRWGSGQARIIYAKSSIKNNTVEVSVKIKAFVDIETLIYGLHIIGPDGTEVTAVNNRMINKPDIEGLRADQIVDLSWIVLDIFSTGKFTVSLTLVNESGVVYDWFSDAVSFISAKELKSTTAVIPPIDINFKNGKVNDF